MPMKIAAVALAASCFFFFQHSVAAQESQKDLARAPGGAVAALTPEAGPFTEPAVAVNPGNPQQVVAAYQDNVHISYSTDGGSHWTAADNVAPPNYKVSGDVSLAFDHQSHAFLCYIAFDKLGSFNYWARGATRNGIFVRRSLDGGKTWEKDHFPVAEQPSQPGIPFEDKPVIVADNTASRFAGNLYIGWTRWRIADSQMVFSRSTDMGKTWSQAIEIDDHPGLPRDDNGAAEGFDAAIGPDGTVYAIWSQGDDVWFTTSHDGGQKFSHARPILHTTPIMFDVATLERANGFPQIGIDPKSGRLYVCWSDYRNGDLDVFVATSTDHGKNWSAPVRVNDDPVHNGAEQFFQWMAVDPVDGSANVVFYDRRGDPRQIKQTVVLARSTDAGSTFTNYAWTTEPFAASSDIFFGDYSGLAAYGGRVFGIWTEVPNPPAEKPSDKATPPGEQKSANDLKTGEAQPGETEAPKDIKTPAAPATEKAADTPKPPAKPKGTVVKVGVADFRR